jgi:hypothetical protein
MATLASPLFDRSFGRPVVPPGAVPDDPPAALRRAGILRALPRQEMAAARVAERAAAPAASFAARQAAPGTRPATPPTTPPPTRPTSQQPTSPEPPHQPGQRARLLEPPRRPKELDWLTWQLSDALRKKAREGLRETLRWRARCCETLPPPPQPVERSRFGLRGEALVPESTPTVRAALYSELRETVRTVEAPLSWSERNFRLAMHSTRLGQLCRELEQRGADDVLEIIRAGLVPLWD